MAQTRLCLCVLPMADIRFSHLVGIRVKVGDSEIDIAIGKSSQYADLSISRAVQEKTPTICGACWYGRIEWEQSVLG